MRWKTPVGGRGWSSPAILGDRIWLTTATEDGRSLRALSFDRESGKQLVDIEVFRLRDPGSIHGKNSHASPTPILEGDRVYLHFGAHGTACLNSNGQTVWKTRLEYVHGHGPGGSPVLYDDLVIISCDGYDTQYVVALDKSTGKNRWKSRRSGYHAYSTPLVLKLPSGDQVVSPGGRRTVAYDPRSGREIWSVGYGNGYSNVPRPVFGHGLVFLCSGFDQPSLLAVRPDGKGDVTRTHVAWSTNRGVPHTSSPIVVGDELYMVSDNGIAACLDARTGREHWRQRLGGGFSASPVYADGRIYFLSEEGETVVIAPGREFRKLAENRLDGQTLASIAVSGTSLFIRSATHLYRIESATASARPSGTAPKRR